MLVLNLANLDHEQLNFSAKKYRWSNQQLERQNFRNLGINISNGTSRDSLSRETTWFEKFVSLCSAEEFILEQENKDSRVKRFRPFSSFS